MYELNDKFIMKHDAERRQAIIDHVQRAYLAREISASQRKAKFISPLRAVLSLLVQLMMGWQKS
jgi:hypothetical protein